MALVHHYDLRTLKTNLVKAWLFILLAFYLVVANAAEATPNANHPTAESIFAEVNGEKISIQEFQSAFQAGMRKRFYHGKIPKAELQAFRKEVSQTLIDRILLVEEAKRQNVNPDAKKVDKQLAQYEKRYADRPFWKENKENVIPGLRKALEEESILRRFEDQVKSVGEPTETQVKDFYSANPELFTTPEKMRVSLILLKVQPSSPGSVWEAAQKEAGEIIQRLKKGGDFAQLARIHSGDASAINGGDMGFIHQGMLAEPAQKALDKLAIGQVSNAVMTLQGIAIFRLDEKQSASLNEFSNVKTRAGKLLKRENAKQAWSNLLDRLRADAKIKINEDIIAVNNK